VFGSRTSLFASGGATGGLALGSSGSLWRGFGDLLDLGLLGLLSLACGDLLLLAFLDLLVGSLDVLVTLFAGLTLLALELLDRKTDDGSLNAGGLAGTLLHEIVDLDLLVECTPGERPGELDGLDFLVE